MKNLDEMFGPKKAGVIRHALTAGGGALVSWGVIGEADVQTVVGAVVTVIGVVWSVWSKLAKE